MRASECSQRGVLFGHPMILGWLLVHEARMKRTFFNAWNCGSVSGVLEQMESNSRGRTAQNGIFRRIEGIKSIH